MYFVSNARLNKVKERYSKKEMQSEMLCGDNRILQISSVREYI